MYVNKYKNEYSNLGVKKRIITYIIYKLIKSK